MCVDVAGYKIVNVYKHPRSRLISTFIPTYSHPILYVGDFNCQHVNWRYRKTTPDGESLDSWETTNHLQLLYDLKETASFSSHRRIVGTNPDLAFASFGQNNRLPDKRVLGTFPWSQHRPYLTGESVGRLPPPDTTNTKETCRDFWESLLSATKQCIPRGCRKNYVPCWGQECETFYRSFVRAPVGTDSDRAALYLLFGLEQNKQEPWEETVNSIDFLHSIRKAWSTINKLGGGSGHSSRLCTVSENAIALYLMKNGAHTTGSHESTTPMNKQLSDLRTVPTPERQYLKPFVVIPKSKTPLRDPKNYRPIS